MCLYFCGAFYFPHCFQRRRYKLSEKLVEELKMRDGPVAISWRLDPQEVELYIDRRSIVLNERSFVEDATAKHKIKKIMHNYKEETLFFHIQFR